MTRAKQTQKPGDALTTTYAEEADLWRRFIAGGIIACKSEGKAIHLRQRMYVARQLMQQEFGTTPYDDLIIKRPRGDNRLTIQKRDMGILELMPNDPIIENEEFVAVARQPTETDKQMDDLIKGLEDRS